MKNHAAISVFMALAIAGCASKSADIAPSYVSPMNYQNYTCEQLSEEGRNVSSRAAIASGQQDKARSRDAVKTGVGVVLFWPVLLFMDGDGPKSAELASLKGQMDAIEQASIQKKCRIEFQRQ